MAASSKSKSSYHHGDLRAALIDAAVVMAEEEGVDAITTRALARKLGVSHAAPGRHFPDRRALLAAVAAASYERFARALENAAREEEGAEALTAMGRAYVRFGVDHPALLSIMFSQQLGDLDPWPADLHETAERAYRALESGVRSALGPEAAPEKISLGAFTAWSFVHGAVTLYRDGRIKHQLPARGRRAHFLAMADAAAEAATRAVMALR